MAGEQSSVGMQQRPKALEHAPLRRAIEIDHRVSAEDRVERAANRPYGGHQVHRAKAHEGAHLGAYPRVARFVSRALQEEALQALFAELLAALERVDAEVRGAYSAGIEIRPEDAHPRIRTQGFDRGDGHRIGFLARRARRGPERHRAVLGVLAQELREDREVMFLAEERRQIRRQRVDELLELELVRLELLQVLGEALEPERTQPPRHAAVDHVALRVVKADASVGVDQPTNALEIAIVEAELAGDRKSTRLNSSHVKS